MQGTMIFGPPGTGKTSRIVREVAGSVYDNIVVVSFTRAAAAELVQRIQKPDVRAQTLHSMAYKLAGIVPDQVFNREWAKQLSAKVRIPISMANSNDLEEMSEGDRYLAVYAYGRATLNTDWPRVFMQSGADGSLQKFEYFVSSYESFKSAYGIVDFSDMLDRALGLNPDADLLVLDEAQDFSPQQWRLVESWLPHVKEVVVAGDDDQAIYKWSGADPHGMFKFESKFGLNRCVLDQSYRIPSSVHRVAEGLIQKLPRRVPKGYRPRTEEGSVARFGDIRQVSFDENIDTLILVRNHSLRPAIEELLISRAIRYDVDGGLPGPLNNHFARAIRAWKRAQYNMQKVGDMMLPAPELKALDRCAHPIYRGRLEEHVQLPWDRVLQIPQFLRNYYRAVQDKIGEKCKIRISTIHNSKGREADRVVLINGMGNRTAQGDVESEIRTFYVGVTRARHELMIVMGENPLRELT